MAGEEPLQPVAEEEFYEEQSRGGSSISDKLKNLWGKIIEVTDEKIDDRSSN